MADICVVYAREDRDKAAALERALTERGWSVWWDEHIGHGDYRREIERQLSTARCVIPLWSRRSVGREWVLEEAQFAKDRNIPLLPVRLDATPLPLGYTLLQTFDLRGWPRKTYAHAGLNSLCRAIERCVKSTPRRRQATEATTLVVGGKLVPLPCFLRSVSSFETLLRPDASLGALRMLRTPAVLVSAYDLARDSTRVAMLHETRGLLADNSFVVLDSGNYEAARRHDRTWTAREFGKIASEVRCDLVLSFDNLKPPSKITLLVDDALRRVERGRGFTGIPNVCPVLHGPRLSNGTFDTTVLPEAFAWISAKMTPDLIAIPERELGNGIVERAKTVHAVRMRLEESGKYQAIHLLGTGNPISMAILSAAGADVFDGLEWCRTVADHEDGLLYHPQHYDFFSYQTGLLAPEPIIGRVIRTTAEDMRFPYPAKLAVHNLEFFDAWTRDLQQRRRAGTIDRLLASKLPKSFDKLAASLPEVFK